MLYMVTSFKEDNMTVVGTGRNAEVIMGKAKMCQRIRRKTGYKAIY